MHDAATLAVLRDAATFVIIAIAIGFAAYAVHRRAYPQALWQYRGKVVAFAFAFPDVILAGIFMLTLLSGVLFGEATVKEPVNATAASELEQAGAVLSQMVFMLTIAFLIIAWLRFLRRLDPGELFGVRNLGAKKVFLAAVLWMIPAFLLVIATGELTAYALKDVWPMDSPQEIVKSFQTTSSVPIKILMAIAAVVVAPLTEELLFRGFFYGIFKRFTDSWFAAIISALLFATVHVHVGSFVPLFALALCLVAAYEHTGSLLVPMTMHAIFNGVMLTSMLGSDAAWVHWHGW